MDHRNIYCTPQILETESHQGRSYTKQPYLVTGRASASEGSSLVHPDQLISINGGSFPPPWPPAAPRSRINSPSILPSEFPCFQEQAPLPSCDPFQHQPVDGSFRNYPPPSSSLSGQSVNGGFVNHTTVGSGRGSHKRKSPSTPHFYDRGSTSRYYDIGSSSNSLLPSDPWQDKQNTESHDMPWEYHLGYRVDSLSINGEGTQRNVRSRTAVDQQPNLARTQMPSNSMNCSFSSRPSGYLGQTSNAIPMDCEHYFVSPAGHGVPRGANSSSFGHGPNTMNTPNGCANGWVEDGGYNNNASNGCANGWVEDGGYNNNASIPQNNYGYSNQPRRDVLSSYDQRSAPAFRASSSCFYPGQVAAPGERPIMAAESFPSRHSQAFHPTGFHYSEMNSRTGISSDRYRSFAEESSVPDRFAHEKSTASHPNLWRLISHEDMGVNYTTYNGSRALYDQHRDMRLDIDNMSYEELLALGEQIGSVNTGLSEGMASKCLTHSVYHSSGQSQDKGLCVICLEEYMEMDEVGTLKCGHDFHVGCIRKWLGVKNSCPICNAAAVDDCVKDELSS